MGIILEQHIEINSSLSLGDKYYGVVITVFKGRNVYEGVVTERVTAKVGLLTGDIIETVQD